MDIFRIFNKTNILQQDVAVCDAYTKEQSLIALKYREPLPDNIPNFTAQPKAESHFRCVSAGTAYGECCAGLYLYPFSEFRLLHFRILAVQYCLLVFVSAVAVFTAKAGG
ncbi:hypothetical protein ACNFNZ_04880 [Empedobacter brevis]